MTTPPGDRHWRRELRRARAPKTETDSTMSTQSEPGPFCQSCAMPMTRPEDFGTEETGTLPALKRWRERVPGYAPRGATPRQTASWLPIGSRRMRLPVASKIALHSAGITGGSAGSPSPVTGLSVARKNTSTGGACAMRIN